MRPIVIALLVGIVANLCSALVYVFLDAGKNSDRAVKVFTWQVTLSIALFVVVMVGHYFGWIAGHALNRLH